MFRLVVFFLTLPFLLLKSLFADLQSDLLQYRELVDRKETLAWFADERTKEFFEGLLSGLDKDTKAYLTNNIYGDYRLEIEANYLLKQSELHSLIFNGLIEGDVQSNLQILQNSLQVQECPERLLPGHAPLLRFLSKAFKQKFIEKSLNKEETLLFGQIADEFSKNSKNDSFAMNDEYYRSLESFDVPIWWYDDKNYQILYETSKPQAAVKKIDLNQATIEELTGFEEISKEQAQKIIAFRESGHRFENLRELVSVAGLSEEAVENLDAFITVSVLGKEKKKWTIMVYITASNDLERFGLSDINEMETVGSDENINIITQVDRIDSKNVHPSKADSDFIGEGNWDKTRIYYVNKDEDRNNIRSNLISEIEDVDMGDPRELLRFSKFAIDNYPAERYMLVIWNHGAGWPGISYDDESSNGITLPQLTGAIRKISEHLKAKQGKAKLDILNMDACLMAMVEVGYELKDHVEFMVGSQEVEPGAGMPYGDYLAPLAKFPDMDPRAMSRNLVEKFVLSYTQKGSQSSRYWGGSPVTQSALELSKITPVVKAIDNLAATFLQMPIVWEYMLLGYVNAMVMGKRYATEAFIDLYDFSQYLLSQEQLPDSLRQAALAVMNAMEVPENIRGRTDQTVVLSHDKPGFLVWGVNGWKTPPDSTWPRGTDLFRSRFARTPLKKMENGKYYVALAPFSRGKDRETQAPFFVTELNYRFVDAAGKTMPIEKEGKEAKKENRIISKSEYRIVRHFPTSSPIVIEGHTQGMDGSHGMSIYLPLNPSGFDMSYLDLAFAKDTRWDELVRMIPTFERKNKVLINDNLLDLPEFILNNITAGVKDVYADVDIFLNSRVYQGGHDQVFSLYQNDGIVVSFQPSEKAMGLDHLVRYLDQGGKLVLFSPWMAKEGKYQDFLKKYAGCEYDSMTQNLIEEDAVTEIDFNMSSQAWGGSVINLHDIANLRIKGDGKALIKDKNGRVYASFLKTPKHQMVYLSLPFWKLAQEDQTKMFKEIFSLFE